MIVNKIINFIHLKAKKFWNAPVAQLDRASVFGTEGRRFESVRVYHENASQLCGAFSWSYSEIRLPTHQKRADVITAGGSSETNLLMKTGFQS